MSSKALLYVSTLRDLTAHQRLTAYELAAFHNSSTGQCNASPDKLGSRTKLSGAQIVRHLRELSDMGIIARSGQGWLWPELITQPAGPVPNDWFPTEPTIAELVEKYPQHDFSIQEFVDDFIRFTQRRKILIPPDRIDRAFFHNACTLLDRRNTGKVSLSSEPGRSEPPSVFDFLSRIGS
jgi:hypothetical protein